MGQEFFFFIKWGVVFMEVRSKEDYDVCFFSVIFNFMVWYFFKGQRGYFLLYIKSLANSFSCVQFIYFRGVVVNVGDRGEDYQGGIDREIEISRVKRDIRDYMVQ